VSLTPTQLAFATSREPFPAFVGGFGSGKTAAAIARVMSLKVMCRQQDLAYYLPTYPLVEDIAYRRFPELCERKGWAYRLNKASSYIEFPNAGRIIFRTMERPERIVGYQVAHSICDELDTLPMEKAREVWNKIIARNRQKCDMANTVAVATTPEGFRLVHELWVKRRAPGYVLFRAKTMENAENLPDGYIDNLRNTYPTQQLSAYLDGEFVNLTSGSVYAEFDRALNTSRETIKEGETLHVGLDFNVGKMAAVLFVLRDGEPHAAMEIVDVLDTPAMAAILKARYKEHGHSIMVYPDASGNARKSNNASESDLAILRQAGFQVCVNSRNPAVKDRVLSYNKMIHSEGARRFRVNVDACPHLVESLEKQAYDKHGEPDKSGGLDHVLDASGYFIVYRYPIIKRIASATPLRM
jgi:phage terminase large subunit